MKAEGVKVDFFASDNEQPRTCYENLRNILTIVTSKSFYVRHSTADTKIKIRTSVCISSKRTWFKRRKLKVSGRKDANLLQAM
jgi:hypothetical protein